MCESTQSFRADIAIRMARRIVGLLLQTIVAVSLRTVPRDKVGNKLILIEHI